MIGAGLGGLAAAIRLQARGHQVTVLEKNSQPGGRASVIRMNGFTFDAGPTIITAPHLIRELFALAGRQLEDSVRLIRLDPFYRVRFHDGTAVDWGSDESARESAIASLNTADVAGYRRFAARAAAIFEQAFPLVDQPFESLGQMVSALPSLVQSRAWRSVARLAEGEVRDERVRQLLSFHPLLIGGNPFATPAIYALIHELERRWGVWFAEGGTGAVVRALSSLFESIGGSLCLGSEAVRLEVEESGKAVAVSLANGGRVPADTFVCNGDVVRSYRDLVPAGMRRVNSDRRLTSLRQGMSLFVIYFGTRRRYDGIAHHEILLGPRYRPLLEDIFHGSRLARDFSLYLHRPTATDPSLAPPGCDAWYVLSPVPNLSADIDWEVAGIEYRDRIIEHLESVLLPGLSNEIVAETRIDPRHFRDNLNSHLGNAFSFQPLLGQSAWFRPHVRSEDVRNLYFVGAGTHPGAGVPGVLSSARIVDRLIADDVTSSAKRRTLRT